MSSPDSEPDEEPDSESVSEPEPPEVESETKLELEPELEPDTAPEPELAEFAKRRNANKKTFLYSAKRFFSREVFSTRS